jgi:hypothetical protein
VRFKMINLFDRNSEVFSQTARELPPSSKTTRRRNNRAS